MRGVSRGQGRRSLMICRGTTTVDEAWVDGRIATAVSDMENFLVSDMEKVIVGHLKASEERQAKAADQREKKAS